MNQYIRCITCDAVFAKTLFDQCPEYESMSETPSDPFREVEKDDFKDFMKEHRGHPVEPLQILEESMVSDQPYAEPMKVSYFKATNGKEHFVIKRFRRRIEEPFSYQLIHGDYFLQLVQLDLQADEIRKQLQWEVDSPPLKEEQLEAFVELYRHVLKKMDVDRLERVAYESSHPLEIYYKMDEVSLFYLLRNCRSLFKGDDYRAIESFIHRHKEDGVLLLKATYQIQLVQSHSGQKETLSPKKIIEAKRFLEKK